MNPNDIIYYDPRTFEVVNEQVAKALEQGKGIKCKIAPKNSKVVNGKVVIGTVNQNEVNQEQEIDIPSFVRPEYRQDYSVDMVARMQAQKAQEEKRRQQEADYQRMYAKSVTSTPQRTKKDGWFIYKATAWIMGAVFFFSGMVAGYAMNNAVDQVKDFSAVRGADKAIVQIYNQDEHVGFTTNAVNQSKMPTGKFDDRGFPFWYFNFNSQVENFYELPDETFLTNLYHFYVSYDKWCNMPYNDGHGESNFDHFIELLAENADPEKNPVAFRYLEGVTDFQGFLIKNFAIYEQDPEKYEETFIKMAESQARVDAPILEFTADELMKGTR